MTDVQRAVANWTEACTVRLSVAVRSWSRQALVEGPFRHLGHSANSSVANGPVRSQAGFVEGEGARSRAPRASRRHSDRRRRSRHRPSGRGHLDTPIEIMLDT